MQVMLKDTRCLDIHDMRVNTHDDLDFSDTVVRFAAAHGKLVVATTAQCKAFPLGSSFSAAAATATVDVSHSLVQHIALAPAAFCLLLSGIGLQV